MNKPIVNSKSYPEQVSALYDNLFRFESKWRKDLYPIHKKLNLPAKYKCLYDLVIDHLPPLPLLGSILDAGCGVGFGSILLAGKTDIQVVGYSISSLEIKRAKAILDSLKIENCHFERKGFNDVLPNSFDVIICIESLKHAEDIGRDTQILIDGLRPGGRLIVIDDFYQSDSESGEAENLRQQWHLTELIKESHLDKVVKNVNQLDLSPYQIPKSLYSLKLKLKLYAFLSTFLSKNWIDLVAGGTNLDILYARKEMKYQMLTLIKDGD